MEETTIFQRLMSYYSFLKRDQFMSENTLMGTTDVSLKTKKVKITIESLLFLLFEFVF